MPIREYFKSGETAFDPADIRAMSAALDDVCQAFKLDGNKTARETIAIRIIDLARTGERDPGKLRDRLLADAKGGTGL